MEPDEILSGLDKESVGRRLAIARAALSLQPSQLADFMGWGRTSLSNWEAGTNYAPIERMAAFAKIYGVTLDFIYRGETGALPVSLHNRIVAVINRDRARLAAGKKPRVLDPTD